MKKFLALIAALVMVFAVSATAFAAGDQVHAGELPYTSEQDAKITITGLQIGGDDGEVRLPSEYHVRVKWNVVNGVYKATKTDGIDGFKNFTWNCDILDYELGEVGEGATDVREGNWTITPAVAFEVTNASTPDKYISVTPSVGDTGNTWASLLKGASIEDQNTAIGSKDVPPVLIANLGSGNNSYEEGKGAASHNVFAYDYTFNWNYKALNELALAAFKANSGTQTLTNTFVVTISAASAPAGN